MNRSRACTVVVRAVRWATPVVVWLLFMNLTFSAAGYLTDGDLIATWAITAVVGVVFALVLRFAARSTGASLCTTYPVGASMHAAAALRVEHTDNDVRYSVRSDGIDS